MSIKHQINRWNISVTTLKYIAIGNAASRLTDINLNWLIFLQFGSPSEFFYVLFSHFECMFTCFLSLIGAKRGCELVVESERLVGIEALPFLMIDAVDKTIPAEQKYIINEVSKKLRSIEAKFISIYVEMWQIVVMWRRLMTLMIRNKIIWFVLRITHHLAFLAHVKSFDDECKMNLLTIASWRNRCKPNYNCHSFFPYLLAARPLFSFFHSLLKD